MAQKTRLGLYGGPRQLYGTFSGKAPAVILKGQVTRLGLYGGPRQLYGTFSGKTAADVVTALDDWVVRVRRRRH